MFPNAFSLCHFYDISSFSVATVQEDSIYPHEIEASPRQTALEDISTAPLPVSSPINLLQCNAIPSHCAFRPDRDASVSGSEELRIPIEKIPSIAAEILASSQAILNSQTPGIQIDPSVDLNAPQPIPPPKRKR